jgi:hypothetical protein
MQSLSQIAAAEHGGEHEPAALGYPRLFYTFGDKTKDGSELACIAHKS